MELRAFNFTKIIATLGPSSNTREQIQALIQAGADCFRLNFSHGDGASMQPYIDRIREAAKLEDCHIPILADIQGPKLRVGTVPADGVTLKEGALITLTTRMVEGGTDAIHSPYEHLCKDVEKDTMILLADGKIELRVESVTAPDVVCRVITPGRLYSNKGINIPNTSLSVKTLTEKDHKDLEYIRETDIDLVALSFVRTPGDIRQARKILGKNKIPIIAKLELQEALDNLSGILEEADGIMIARGDLGVEMDFEKVPVVQKQILTKAADRGVWSVVATQMLGSMVAYSRPTRAEVTDVATAVGDLADTIMLSEETAAGDYPVQAVQAMNRISREAEKLITPPSFALTEEISSFAGGAAGAAVHASSRLGSRAIIVLGGSGLTALLVSKWRPHIPVLALSNHLPTLRRLNVLRGVIPLFIKDKYDMEKQIEVADSYLITNELAVAGDPVVVVAAIPLGQHKQTNTVRFHTVRTGAPHGDA